MRFRPSNLSFLSFVNCLRGARSASVNGYVGQGELLEILHPREMDQARPANGRFLEVQLLQPGEPSQLGQAGIADGGVGEREVLKPAGTAHMGHQSIIGEFPARTD